MKPAGNERVEGELELRANVTDVLLPIAGEPNVHQSNVTATPTKTQSKADTTRHNTSQSGSDVSTDCGEGCSRNPHKVSWLICILLWLCLLSFIIGIVIQVLALFLIGWIGGFVMCIPYWVEIQHFSGTRKALANPISSWVVLDEYIRSLRRATPQLEMNAMCYHTEMRTRVVQYTDANGNNQSRTETYTEMVVTHRAAQLYPFRTAIDESDDPTRTALYEYDMTKLKLSKTYSFANEETRQNFDRTYDEFKAANKRDARQVYEIILKLPNFNEDSLALKHKNVGGCCLNQCCFTVSNIFCCSAPYRAYFTSKVGDKQYTVVKSISI